MGRSEPRRPGGGGWLIPVALAVVVAVGAVAYGLLGRLLHGPSVYADELVYMDGARSLAFQGEPLVRGEPYGFGLLYPAVLAPLFRLADSVPEAYAWGKAANAVLFSLAAVPVYLLARRLLPAAWSVVVAALSIAVPSGLYTGLFLTESIAYLAVATAFLLIVLTLERPTAGRQVAALAGIGAAVAARPQFVVLGGVLVGGFALRWLIHAAGDRPSFVTAARRLWPTGAAVVVAAGLLLVSTVGRGTSPLGDYEDLRRDYDPIEVLRLSWYSLAGLGLYLALVPVVVMPAALALLLRRGRGTSRPSAAFAACFVTANALFLLQVGALMSTPFLGGLLHDRYLFYLVPLWLVLFAAWIQAGVPTPRRELIAGAVLVVLLAATFPPRLVVGESARLDGVAVAAWVELRDELAGRPNLLRPAFVVAAVLAVAAAWSLPARARPLLLAAVGALFVTNAALAWKPRVADADRPVFSDGLARDWIDRGLAGRPPGEAVLFWVASDSCPNEVRDAYLWSEFFNRRAARAVHAGGRSFASLRSEPVHVADGGRLVDERGRPVRAAYVIAPPGVELRGRRLGEGTSSGLGLWSVNGPVALSGARNDADLAAVACAPG